MIRGTGSQDAKQGLKLKEHKVGLTSYIIRGKGYRFADGGKERQAKMMMKGG